VSHGTLQPGGWRAGPTRAAAALCRRHGRWGAAARGGQVGARQAAPYRHVRPHPAGSPGPLVGAEADLDRQVSRRDLGSYQGGGLGSGARLAERLGAAAVGGDGWHALGRRRWGTGTGMGVALGAALAFRGTGKVCVSIQNDGDLLYTPGSLWTAAHHDIPMLVV